MSVQIDTIKSIGKCENVSISPDDRQEIVQLVDGAIAIDGWNITGNDSRPIDGDVVGFSATFTKDDADNIIRYWNKRQKKRVVLEDGTEIASARIIVRKISFTDALAFRNKYTVLDLEIWRV